MGKSEKPTVIVVDDDNMMREMLMVIVRSEDYPVIGEASNGLDAIALCAKGQSHRIKTVVWFQFI